ncbi:MAG: hypothetical protein K2X77_21940 [Candidatus Obscuribacterales bacterium]|jgi:hypothetical protein|nr:hypothetical protein [Candidatus Obscuribacterales bacterium]
MPALPGSNRDRSELAESESLLKIEAGKMPALPGSNRDRSELEERESANART